MRLVCANKLYSSWSLRPWLVMRAFDIAFEETVIPLRRPETSKLIGEVSPTGKVPVLIDGDVRVWESLAIIHYLADRFREKAIWPEEKAARGCAMAISAEMHAGFQALRQACPMNLGKRFVPQVLGDEVDACVARLESLWRETRLRFGDEGPFLFGAFGGADAMYAPVVCRLDGYQLSVAPDTRAYMDAVLSLDAFTAWRRAALDEPWVIADYEEGFEVAEVFQFPPS